MYGTLTNLYIYYGIVTSALSLTDPEWMKGTAPHVPGQQHHTNTR